MKKGFTAALAAELDLSREAAIKLRDVMAALIEHGLKEEGRVSIPGLGVFRIKTTKARRLVCFGRGTMTLPAARTVRFRASKDLKRSIQPMKRGPYLRPTHP